MKAPETNAYHYQHKSYLLRLWECGSDCSQRILLQDILTNEQHYFSNLESLFGFLQAPSESQSMKLEVD